MTKRLVRLSQALIQNIFKGRASFIRMSNIYSNMLLENIEIRFFDDLPCQLIPMQHTSADLFYTQEESVFAIHGHMYSKARKKGDFLECL